MKEGWEIKTLGEVCRFINGRAYKKDELLTEGKYRVLRVGNFFTNDHWYFSNLELEEDKFCDKGDLLYAWSASFGPRIWDGEKVIYHYHIWKIELKENLVNKEYTFHLLEWDKEKIKTAHGTGTTMMHVSKGSMEQRIVPIPPLYEQQRIVSIIDKAFEAIDKAIENTKKNLQNAKELFESYLNSVFENGGQGWERKKLGDIASVQYGYTDKSFNEGQFRYIRITDISSDGRLIAEDKKYLADVNKLDLQDYILEHHDLLMARTGATFAKVLLYENFEPSVFASYLIKIKFKVRIENQLFWYFAKTKMYWQQAHHLSSGSAQPQFNGAALKQLEVTYPTDIVKQKELIEEFKELLLKVTQLESQYQQKLCDLEELKKSVLNKAFAGEL